MQKRVGIKSKKSTKIIKEFRLGQNKAIFANLQKQIFFYAIYKLVTSKKILNFLAGNQKMDQVLPKKIFLKKKFFGKT